MGRIALVLLAVVGFGWVTRTAACTCFLVEQDDTIFIGRNYDWDFSDALVLVNKRGLEKSASLDPADTRGRWTARWGSVTFNQYGRDFPCSGMNEKGLVVDVLWLQETVFPADDDRMSVDSVQWVQYQLDTAETVNEVVASLEKVRVRGTVAIHFYVADRHGQAAAIEFLGGKAVVHRTNGSMPAAVLTNHTYEASQAFLRTLEGWGGHEPLPQSTSSLHRFARAAAAARALENGGGPLGPKDVFRVLEDVSQRAATQWSIVYDPVGLRIHFRTRTSRRIKTIDFDGCDFSCRTPVRMIDVDLEAEGNVQGRWSDYTRQANRSLVARSFSKTEFLRSIPVQTLDDLAAYPERARCLQ